MNNEAITLLNIRRLPGRLTVPQTAALLGFAEHDIPILVRKGLLKSLGNPVPNAVKYFAKNTETKEKIAKRAALINTEIEQITKAPADYIASLKKAEVTGDTLTKATTIVNYASRNQRKYRDSDAALKGRTEVRKLLSATQVKALDAALAPK